MIDPALVVGGVAAYLRTISESAGGSIRISISSTATGDADIVGPELIDAWKTYSNAISFSDDSGGAITIKGPDHPDNTFDDDQEPYFWTPDNASAFQMYWTATRTNLQLVLRAASTQQQIVLAGSADLGSPLATADLNVENPQQQIVLSGSADLGSPTASADLTVENETIDPLILTDSDDTGLEVVAKALLVASADGTVGTHFFYADSDRGGTDTPLDGELGLGDDETVVSGFRHRSEPILQLNDNDNPAALDIGAYFDTGGDGDDLTIYLQTLADGEVSFPVAGNVDFNRANQVRFTLPLAGQTLLNNITDGDRWIFKLARPAVTQQQIVLTGDADLGSPTASADLNVENPGQIALSGAANLGNPTAAAALIVENPQQIVLNGSADLGSPTATADLSVANPQSIALAGAANLGNPQARALLDVDNPVSDAQLVSMYAARAFSLAATAPIYAIEIEHPDVSTPIRAVADIQGHTIEGNDYMALPFRAVPPQDRKGQIPTGELSIDYVGRELMQWVEASNGGIGATMRVMKVMRHSNVADSYIGWEVTLDVGRVRITNNQLTVSIVADPTHGRPVVNFRHDPVTSPGLF